MTILHTLAAKQTTVLCSLHQPCSGIFARLSKVILLGHGRTLYFGPPASLAGSLRGFDDSFVVPVGYNAADFALDLVGDMTLQGAVDLADNFAQGARGSALSEEISAVKWNGPQHWDQPHSAERAAGWTLQVCELSRRVLVGMWRNPLLVAAHWTTCCMVAVLMIILYSKTRQAEEEGGAPGVHNRLGALFFVVAFALVGVNVSMSMSEPMSDLLPLAPASSPSHSSSSGPHRLATLIVIRTPRSPSS